MKPYMVIWQVVTWSCPHRRHCCPKCAVGQIIALYMLSCLRMPRTWPLDPHWWGNCAWRGASSRRISPTPGVIKRSPKGSSAAIPGEGKSSNWLRNCFLGVGNPKTLRSWFLKVGYSPLWDLDGGRSAMEALELLPSALLGLDLAGWRRWHRCRMGRQNIGITLGRYFSSWFLAIMKKCTNHQNWKVWQVSKNHHVTSKSEMLPGKDKGTSANGMCNHQRCGPNQHWGYWWRSNGSSTGWCF